MKVKMFDVIQLLLSLRTISLIGHATRMSGRSCFCRLFAVNVSRGFFFHLQTVASAAHDLFLSDCIAFQCFRCGTEVEGEFLIQMSKKSFEIKVHFITTT